MPDQSINCRDCKQTFVCEESEQDFLRSNFPDFKMPTRCPGCRRINRAKREAQGGNTAPPPSRPAPEADRGPQSRGSFDGPWGDSGGRKRSRRDYNQE